MKFGFIGAGNMGGALARAVAKAVAPENITLSDAFKEKAAELAAKLGAKADTAEAVAEKCHFVFLGVKPQVMAAMLSQIAPALKARKDSFVLISMAAGVAIADIQKMAGSDYPVIRIMPNIPASVGSGVILFDTTDNVSEADVAAFQKAMAGAGVVDRLPEKLIDAASALSGCGPAFVSLFIEALADGAVACGLPRDKALLYAAATVKGSAAMVLETEMHPAQLKDAVCSPGGTTIAGVKALEEGAFRGATMNAVKAAYGRTLELGK
ncbi:MAG: pyrroline-5-carboxylate reductase [Oscillospiraceae bacterium]|nr:pyrroline-5-carboxylate reductase [Oscillospiraceae bacterium]